MADDVDLLNDMMQDIDVSEISEKFKKPSEEFCIDCDVEIPMNIVTGKQIGRASCRERVSSPV